MIDEKLVLRERNQLTIPKAAADARNLREGERIMVHIDDEHRNEIVLRVLPDTYVGAPTDAFAGIEAAAHIKAERASWE